MGLKYKILLSILVNAAHSLESTLLDRLTNILTIASVPVMINSLQESNLEYAKLTNKSRQKYIQALAKT